MKTTTAIIATAAALISPVWGGDILIDNNLLLPAEDAPAFKKKAAEQYGTLWMVDAAYGYWHTHRAMPETCSRSNNFLLRVLANQRLLRNDTHGGTWLVAEFDGAWGLDHSSAQEAHYLADGYGSATSPHADARGAHRGVIPELGIMQYLAHKRVCITAGMLNLTNYLDAVSIANCTYCSFTNSGFTNSTVLPLTEANLAAMVQWQFTERDAATLAFTRCGCEAGYNPFHSRSIDGYAVVGEYRHDFADGAYTLRRNPFLKHTHADTTAASAPVWKPIPATGQRFSCAPAQPCGKRRIATASTSPWVRACISSRSAGMISWVWRGAYSRGPRKHTTRGNRRWKSPTPCSSQTGSSSSRTSNTSTTPPTATTRVTRPCGACRPCSHSERNRRRQLR